MTAHGTGLSSSDIFPRFLGLSIYQVSAGSHQSKFWCMLGSGRTRNHQINYYIINELRTATNHTLDRRNCVWNTTSMPLTINPTKNWRQTNKHKNGFQSRQETNQSSRARSLLGSWYSKGLAQKIVTKCFASISRTSTPKKPFFTGKSSSKSLRFVFRFLSGKPGS